MQGTPSRAEPAEYDSEDERQDALHWIRGQIGVARYVANLHASEGDRRFSHSWERTARLLQILEENFEPWLDEHAK